ncbi:MAG TPA: alanine dehydrogenase [Egibacteraceae bacterium]|nr:alanine dehydrogenase [Actinomycetota bacterium]HWB71930.1 alanine dehydrogenase [Egibacteraceae bacterium]
MRIGVPREVKEAEYRVAITPAGVRELSHEGHDVLVQAGAGEGSALDDDDYRRAGASIVGDAADVWGDAQLVLKVKEPVEAEFALLRDDLTLFTFLHLAASRPLTEALVASGCTAVAYETVFAPDGSLPLLAPMSEVAGRMAPHVGAQELHRPRGGRGVLMGGVSGVLPAKVVVIGAGTAGRNAAWIAAGMEANVTILDLDVGKLRYVDSVHLGKIVTLTSNRLTIEEQVTRADLVIGAVLIPGARAPVVIAEEMVASMRPGAVLVDISIDQGGCADTSRVTTHNDPTYVKYQVVHYCVGNMPGAVPRTSTYGLTNATLPYVVKVAGVGLRQAASDDPGLAAGINVAAGAVTNAGVADAHGLEPTSLEVAIGLR